MKKSLAAKLLVLLMAVLLVITGCSTPSPESKSESNSESNAVQTPITIDFWHALSGNNGEAVKQLVDKYNLSQSDIKVDAVFQGDYYENAAKLQAALVAGNQPDMIMLEVALVGQFVAANTLVDLEKYFTKDEISNYQEGLLKDTYVDGTLAAIPFNRSTPVLYVNKDMLIKAGLDPKGPKTWDELRSFSQVIKQKIPGVVGCEIPVDIWFLEAGLFQQDGTLLSEDNKQVAFNNEKGETIIKFWQDMINEGSMKSPVGKDYNGWDAAMADFVGEKTAMITVSTAYLKGLLDKTAGKFEIVTTFLPAKEPGKYATPAGGANLAILNKSSDAEKDAAVKFIKWLSTKDNVGFFCEFTGYVPITKDGLVSNKLKTLYEKFPQYKTAVDQLQYVRKRSIVKGYREIAVTVQEEIRRALLDTKITPKTAIESTAKRVQILLDENK